jgi:hypothetical protein
MQSEVDHMSRDVASWLNPSDRHGTDDNAAGRLSVVDGHS